MNSPFPGTGDSGSAQPSGPIIDVEIVMPVNNEQADLDRSVRRLHAYLQTSVPFTATITIADNASTDDTWSRAQQLAAQLPGVRAVHLDAKGRGRALHQVWAASTARVVAYMDVDLSTDLNALAPLLAPLLCGQGDVSIGSRLSRASRVVRGRKRDFISRCYNRLLQATLHAGFSDAQCGFKAMRTECAHALLPYVRDTDWFFDTELLVLAERSGLRIVEVAVDWIDDEDSRVDIFATALADLRGIARLMRVSGRGELPLRQLHDQLGRPRIDGDHAPSGGAIPAAPFVLELSVLLTANLAATILRFVLLQEWVFAAKRASLRSNRELIR